MKRREIMLNYMIKKKKYRGVSNDKLLEIGYKQSELSEEEQKIIKKELKRRNLFLFKKKGVGILKESKLEKFLNINILTKIRSLFMIYLLFNIVLIIYNKIKEVSDIWKNNSLFLLLGVVFKCFGIITIIGSFCITYIIWKKNKQKNNSFNLSDALKCFFFIIVIALLIQIFGIVGYMNASFGEQNKISVIGKVINKEKIYTARGNVSYKISILNIYNNMKYNFYVGSSMYDLLEIEDYAGARMMMGSQKILYGVKIYSYKYMLEYFKNNDYTQSIKECERILENNPKDIYALYIKGVISEKLNDFKEAIYIYREIEKISFHDKFLQEKINFRKKNEELRKKLEKEKNNNGK